MQKTSLCMVCRSKPARYSCQMCGRLVCEDCYDQSSGTCAACMRGRIAGLGKDVNFLR